MTANKFGTEAVGALATFHDSRRIPLKSSERIKGSYPYYGASGIVDWVDGYLFEGLHLLVSEDGENLRSRSTPIAFLANDKFWVNNHAHVLRGANDGDTKYLAYAIQASDVATLLTGSAQPKLSQGALSSLRVPAPDLVVREGIAEVLGALDDKIAANARVVEAAEELLVAEASRSSSTVAVHEIADHVKLSIRPTEVSGVRVAHYSLPSFDEGKLPSFDETDSILSSKFSIQRPAVLFSKLNPRFPRVWDVPAPEEGAVASTEFLVLEPKGVSTSELWAALSQPELRTKLADRASGTSGSHQRVRPVEVMEAQVPDPRALAPAMREGFVSSGERIALARVESRHLAALRDALLPELMSGRMTVAQAENQVEEVV